MKRFQEQRISRKKILFWEKPSIQGVGRKGFTLIEILIVITIILSFSILMNIKHNDEILLENTANEIVSAIRYARARYDAGDNQSKFVIAYSNGQYSYRVIHRAEGTLGLSTAVNVPIDNKILLSRALSGDETDYSNYDFKGIGSLGTTISFNESSSTGISLLLTSETKKSIYMITVVPSSSRVHLYKVK